MAGASEVSPLDTVRLEKEYEKAIADSARLLDTERDRVRRMEYLLLQFERDALQAKLDQANDRIHGLTQAESEARLQLDEAFQEIDHLDQSVQASSSEIQRLTEELSTRNNTSTGYSTLQTEKMQLSRELSNTKSKLERLQTQNTSHQATVAEKQAMERQLNSVELQLENEKNSHERARAKSSEQATQITSLSSKIEELQNELVREQRANKQRERDDQQQNGGWEKERSVLEGKIETLRKQLRSTKDKLHEAQQDLLQRHIIARGNEVEGAEAGSRRVPLQRPGPSAESHGVGMTIATPGAVRVQEKPKRQSALPGDKSAFSITPFLNRTGPAPRDTPISSDVDEDEVKQARKESRAAMRKPSAVDEPNDGNSSPGEQPPPKAKLAAAKPRARAAKPGTSKGAHDSNQPASRPTSKVPLKAPEEPLNDPPPEQGQAKTKRRKLGAQRERSLFEDEDEDDILGLRKPRKLALGGGRQSVLAAPLSTSSGGDILARGGGFGAARAFSPLKRDRMR
ncbi:uncharacterized protein N7496_012561 [Penicillium cataractarum]|uniref:Uncharacterized protein n=1 Tax=Penicillium cataractarum TaxID=2100454 RepID=A0A9W9R9U5_9EURO|nr:uncharacterized protein N7496_012561 [Penicillium cataractarum]KAJ5355349.1 hypothetical protein N7496_012561 [Penicillium cataractarum]